MNDYPDVDDLERIKAWPYTDYLGLMDFVKSLWWAADWGWSEPRRYHYAISTAGWSGNEDLIGAMQLNYQFWSQCFVSHRRGGHYRLHIPAHVRKFKTATVET